MKFLKYFVLITFMTISAVHATFYIVDNVKVSATADSAAAAREKAIQQGYAEAYNKLMIRLRQEGAPTRPDAPDSQDLVNMVLDFSVDREKNTSTSYSALMTFQFDPVKIDNWISGLNLATNGTPTATTSPQLNTTGTVTVFIAVTDLQSLNTASKALLEIPGVKSANLQQLTTHGALINLTTGMAPEALMKATSEKNINIVIQ